MFRDVAKYTDTVREQYRRFLADRVEWLERVDAAPPDYTAETVDALAAKIGARLGRQEPYCLVRLGDGEGACLNDAHEDYPELARAVYVRTLALHFGRKEYDETDFAFWRDSVERAARAADLLACPTRRQCIGVGGRRQDDIRGGVGIVEAGVFVLKNRRELAAETFATWHVHLRLLPHYADLARDRRVGLVTCYGDGFPDRLGRAFGCADVDPVIIPGQAVNEKGIDVPLYPGELDRVKAEVEARASRGMLWLIAAGLAGKELCALAAGKGAVAIDVGSVMDAWYGRSVRPYQNDDFVARNTL